MTQEPSRQPPDGGRTDQSKPPGVTEEIEVRGHIVDSLLLPKILDRILLDGGDVRDPGVQDRRASHRPELCADRDPCREPRGARRRSWATWSSTAPRRMHPEDATTSRPTSPAHFPKGFTARPTSPRRSG